MWSFFTIYKSKIFPVKTIKADKASKKLSKKSEKIYKNPISKFKHKKPSEIVRLYERSECDW